MPTPNEAREITDRPTGRRLRQLTDYKGHSHHFYFTNPGWFDGGCRMYIGSDRANRANLFAIERATGALSQLTDLAPEPEFDRIGFIRAAVNPISGEACFFYGRQVLAVDGLTGKQRVLAEIEPGWVSSMLNVTADGRYLLTGMWEDLSDRIDTDLLHGYVGFEETWEAMPLSRILRIPTDGSGTIETVFEERYWVGHVNTSPVHAHLLTYCHEGPWHKVDQRIWGLDLNTGQNWKIRATTEPGEAVGHEYWLADGETLGFHGHRDSLNSAFLGCVRYDDTALVETPFSRHTGHIHSNDRELIVGDGGGVIKLWRRTADGYEGPRLLCEHRSSSHIQHVHPHPRFTPDGTHIVFTSDRSGYGQVYEIEVPAFDDLEPINE